MTHPISGATRLAAVIGDPIRHSLSPAIHNAGFAALDADWVMVALPVAAGHAATAVAAMRDLDVAGLSVTMPHKEAVIEHLDELTPMAERLGAVNSVRATDGRLVGDNTDGGGFVDSVLAAGHDVAGRRVAVLGAGGAARAVVLALAEAGAGAVQVVGRTPARAEAAAALAGDAGSVAGPEVVAGAEIVVNATPVGMGEAGGLPPGAEHVHSGHVVVDLVYHPLRTPLLALAAERGARTVDGVGMLVHQAARQQEGWLGRRPPIVALETAARDQLGG